MYNFELMSIKYAIAVTYFVIFKKYFAYFYQH